MVSAQQPPNDAAPQREQWETALSQPERYGASASEPARAAAASFENAHAREVLELGAGQGRDTIFLAARGFDVHALDFAKRGLSAIRESAARAGLRDRVHPVAHDVREPLPFPDERFDACYSHMLYCMALSELELTALSAEIHRVLRPGALNVYTARTTADPDHGRGIHRGEQLYETGGFVVHFFDRALIERLAGGYDILAVDEFQEGPLPRHLYRVTLRKRPA